MANPKPFKIFVDNTHYEWSQNTITGAQLRTLAAIPEGVQIFQHIPGQPDKEISNTTVVDVANHHGPVKFSTQSPGSSAG